ncbi:MAG: hypothetical protein LBU15_03115, partial [Rickettsiales bacterium]|nr:hypothetical protein [Rickettsiales bacterium]
MYWNSNGQHVSLTIDGITYSGTMNRFPFAGNGKWELKGVNGKQIELNGVVFSENGAIESGTVMVKDKSGIVCQYAGKFSGGQPSGKGKMTYYRGGKFSGTYNGDWKGGKRHGYGTITNAGGTEEGDFSEGQPQRTCAKSKGSGLNYYLTYNNEGKITSYQLLSKEPGRKGEKIKIPDPAEMDEPSSWLYKTTISYGGPGSTGRPSGTTYECHSHGQDGSLKAEVKIFPGMINELLSGGTAKSLEELLVQGAIVITDEGGPEGTPQNITEPGKAREILKAALEKPTKIRTAGESAGFSGGTLLETQLMMLLMIKDENFKNVRLCTETVSYSSMTSLLESIGINEGNLGKIGEDHIIMLAETDTEDHVACFIVDLKKIREVLKEGKDWKSLDTSNEIFIHCFNSSREGTFGAVEKNLDNVNRILQELGSCWFHGLAAVMAALENPEMVGRVLDGKIPSYKPEDQWLKPGDVPNEFMLKHVLELQKIESILGISLGEGKLLVEGIVKDDFKSRAVELADGTKLLEELSKRIDEAFKTFEEKLKKLGSEVPELLDTEYEDYKKKTTKEYGKNLIAKATPPATDNAKEVPEFLEGSEKL